MKNLLLAITLFLTVNVFSQEEVKQFRRIYTKVCLIEGENKKWSNAENIFFFNYGNEPKLKVYFSDGSTRTYLQISDRERGMAGKAAYEGAYFKGDGMEFFLQIFTDEKYGCRMVFDDYGMLQFTN